MKTPKNDIVKFIEVYMKGETKIVVPRRGIREVLYDWFHPKAARFKRRTRAKQLRGIPFNSTRPDLIMVDDIERALRWK